MKLTYRRNAQMTNGNHQQPNMQNRRHCTKNSNSRILIPTEAKIVSPSVFKLHPLGDAGVHGLALRAESVDGIRSGSCNTVRSRNFGFLAT